MTTTNLNTPASAQAASRTGSALLIVVGTLALIAVFAAIYISIGQSDQRVASSIKNKVEVEEYRDVIADHLAGVIAMDRLDITTHHIDAGTDLYATTEVTDAPYTDWSTKSESNNDWDLFNPSGRNPLIADPIADLEIGRASCRERVSSPV